MNTRTAAVALLLAFTPVAASSRTAFAQTAPPDDATTKAAHARFQEGVGFFDKGQFENARAAFLQAYALRKHPAVLINLAQSSLRAGHTLEAAKFFTQYLHESSSLTDAQRGDAEKGLADARTKLGRIDVSAAAGAEISLDGDKVGTTPLADPVDVEPGTHKVSARSADGSADTKSVTVAAGQQVSAHFGPGGQGAVTPPTPPETPPNETPTPPEPTPAKQTEGAHTAPSPEKKAEGGWGIWSSGHLATYVPTVIGGVVGLAGFGTAIVLAISKGSAQSSATSVANEIMSNGGTQGTCYNTPPSSRFYQACNTLASNNNNVNTDALVANIGVAVGIVGAVGALGWFLLGPRHADEAAPLAPTTAPTAPPTTSLIPFVGPHTGGLGVVSTF
jgi:hypothetical protein